MISFLIVVHIIICALLIVSILMQSSKGGGLAGGMFGGGGSMGGVFGGRGASSFLSKVSLWLGIAFGLTSLSIGLLSLRSGKTPKSVVQDALESQRSTSPASALPTVPSQQPAQSQPVPVKPNSK
jgi:preprotein translocase subunit SecG